MRFTVEQIEYLHKIGKIKDQIYYQINGKTANENYRTQKQNRKINNKSKITENNIEKILYEVMKNELSELINDLIQ